MKTNQASTRRIFFRDEDQNFRPDHSSLRQQIANPGRDPDDSPQPEGQDGKTLIQKLPPGTYNLEYGTGGAVYLFRYDSVNNSLDLGRRNGVDAGKRMTGDAEVTGIRLRTINAMNRQKVSPFGRANPPNPITDAPRMKRF